MRRWTRDRNRRRKPPAEKTPQDNPAPLQPKFPEPPSYGTSEQQQPEFEAQPDEAELQENQPAAETILRRPDGSLLVDGRVSVEELADRLGLDDVGGEFHTAAGLALERLARIPVEGDTFDIGDWCGEVIDMDGKRIDKLLFVPAPAEPSAD